MLTHCQVGRTKLCSIVSGTCLSIFSSFTNYSVCVPTEWRMLCCLSSIFITFQIQYIIPSLSPFTLYLCLRDKLFPLPRGRLFLSVASAFIRIKYAKNPLLLFSRVCSLSVALPSNDTFCHSKVFSISLSSFFKEMDLKGLEQVKTCGLNSNSGLNSKDHPGLNHSQRVPGASTQTRDEGHTVTTCGFYR